MTSSRFHLSRRSVGVVVLTSLLLSACAEPPIPPVRWVSVDVAAAVGDATAGGAALAPTGPLAAPALLAAANGAPDFTSVTGVTLTVTGPGIATPLLFDLGVPQADGRTAPFSVTVPAGSGRQFTARAYTGSVVSHRSTDTLDLTDAGATVHLYLRKVTGTGAGGAALEDFAIQVDDSTGFGASTDTILAPRGATRPLAARVVYATTGGGHTAGDPVPGVSVAWAVENPGIAGVTPTACTTGADGACGTSLTVRNNAKSGDLTGVVASYSGQAYRLVLRVP